MKITLNTKEALAALTRGVKAIPAKILNLMDGNVLIKAEDDSVALTTSDGEMSIVTVLKSDKETGTSVGEAGAACVNAKILLEMLSVIDDDTVGLQSVADGVAVSVAFSNGRHTMPSHNPDDFRRTVFAVDDPVTAELPAKLLTDILSSTLFNCLMVHSLPDIKSETPVAFLLPQKQGNLLLAAVKTLKGDDDKVSIDFGTGAAIFHAGNSTISIKSLNGKFPDWKQILPGKTPNELTIKKDEFLSTLKRISTCAGAGQRCVKLSIKKTLVDSTMEVNASDAGYNISARETVPVTYEGEDMTIGFDADILQDIVRHIDSETITIGMTDSKKPALLTPVETKENVSVRAVLVPFHMR